MPTYPAAIPARIELNASSLFRIHRNAHLTVRKARVDALRNRIIERYYGVNDFFTFANPLVSDFRDLSSCRIELIIRPYLTCFNICFRVSWMHPFGCLQNLVLASILVLSTIFQIYYLINYFIHQYISIQNFKTRVSWHYLFGKNLSSILIFKYY